MALTRDPGCAVTVIDVGNTLEHDNAAALARMAAAEPQRWSAADREVIATRPTATTGRGLPEKRVHGSDYPFRDVGQLTGIEVMGVHRALVSGAYGGFSAVWGAQILPFPDSAFDDWPVDAADMASHYRAVLSQIPFAGTGDDLAEALPLHAEPSPPPAVSQRARLVLDAYARHRRTLRDAGFRVGQSRLALHGSGCRLVGLCMSGCPYSLIYSAAQTFDALRSRGAVAYHAGLLAVGLAEDQRHAVVTARDLSTGAVRHFEADRVLVACGAMGTTRLVLTSRGQPGDELTLAESAQFVMPLLSRRATADPRTEPHHTLGQVSMTLPWDDFRDEPAHLQVYTYDPSFLDALPGPARREPMAGRLLRHLSVGLGYLPSAVSPRIRVRVESRPDAATLVSLRLSSEDCAGTRPALRGVIRRVLRAAPRLDLWPILPRVELSLPGKSYHWGGSFSSAGETEPAWRTDALGRLPGWRRIHLVDASVFPSIAATTFTLTEMANAHRIASAVSDLPEAA